MTPGRQEKRPAGACLRFLAPLFAAAVLAAAAGSGVWAAREPATRVARRRARRVVRMGWSSVRVYAGW